MKIEDLQKENINVSDIVEYVRDEICNKYCKYPHIWDEEKEGVALECSEVCSNRPLGLLG